MRASGSARSEWRRALVLGWVAVWIVGVGAALGAGDNVNGVERDGTGRSGTGVKEPDLETSLSEEVLSLSATATVKGVELPRSYVVGESECPSRSINYITRTLPQQCATSSWSAPSEVIVNETNIAAETTPSSSVSTPAEGNQDGHTEPSSTTTAIQAQETGKDTSSTVTAPAEAELETDSPLDNANFLSFEEWKKKNLEQIGQSPENVGQGRAASSQPARRRPVNVNDLDSLGEEAEIELDFSGFGSPQSGDSPHHQAPSDTRDISATRSAEGEGKAAPSSWALSKDAGKTCKERFNYASFDCAATVLKTNKQAKSSSSILVENKDSYMLNECSAANKFLIVELCDDILVDTVVLANYEFFSSMFRHFRVAVSDRYPVKLERWRTLATFEARNTRDIQPFLIREPQIWARYLRIEFLSQYGNEFYCPLSLLRVHGTTMMEQFRREEEEARGIEDEEGFEAASTGVIEAARGTGPIPEEEVPVVVKEEAVTGTQASKNAEADLNLSVDSMDQSSTFESAKQTHTTPESQPTVGANESSASETTGGFLASPTLINGTGNETISNPATRANSKPSVKPSSSPAQSAAKQNPISSHPISANATTASAPINATASSSVSAPAAPPKAQSNNTSTASASTPRVSPTQPSAPTPSTQESFFKSIHKRLLSLEANSTLSLQYIESQSILLRTAFAAVEKRQLAKTESFLQSLNASVMAELTSYRALYDQLWHSTVVELDGIKAQQRIESSELATRLALLADELVWQKRMAVVQSSLLLMCLGLVLFVRSGSLGGAPGFAADIPMLSSLSSKASALFEGSPSPAFGRDDDPRRARTDQQARRRRGLGSLYRSDASANQSISERSDMDADTDALLSPANPDVESHSPLSSPPHEQPRNASVSSSSSADSAALDALASRGATPGLHVLETQSGPPTPCGSRDVPPEWPVGAAPVVDGDAGRVGVGVGGGGSETSLLGVASGGTGESKARGAKEVSASRRARKKRRVPLGERGGNVGSPSPLGGG